MEQFAEIIVSINHKDVDRIFHYGIPGDLAERICTGMRVLVPFGGGNKKIEGYVIGFSETLDIERSKIKDIAALLDDFPVFSPEMLELALWMKEKYYTTLSECIRCIMPSGIAMKNDYVAQTRLEPQKLLEVVKLKGKQRRVLDYITANGGAITQRELNEQFGIGVMTYLKSLDDKQFIDIKHIYEVKDYSLRVKTAYLNEDNENIDAEIEAAFVKRDKQADVLGMIVNANGAAVSDIKSRLHISDSPIKTLEKKGLIRIENVETRRNLFENKIFGQEKSIVPTPEQVEAISFLQKKLDSGDRKPVLIHGVTGSGKTEIYMKLIEEVIQNGKQAIMLVPEISLTPQAVETFTMRFRGEVTVTHSRLSLGERFDQWKKARDGQVSVMIGPRSAIFTPFRNLGVIIIDEEHENTYKSETSPKYYVKEVAEKLSGITGCMVVLGSATPNVSTYYEAECGKLDLITLKERVNKHLPAVEIVDMRYELANGNRSVFSEALYNAISENLENKQQTILFMNRRGHSTFVSCRSCGYVMQCDDCNVNYTYHMYTDKLICHYCGKQEKNPQNCPICGSKHIKYFGVGTQKIEEEIRTAFPKARALRMDLDTTGRKNSHERIITAFSDGEADILIGTQMIAKGLNFPNVSLVGIIAADIALNTGDFRSAEMAYQLMTQVSGRAGRAEILGKVYIQTYNPEHYSIIYAQDNNYAEFYQHEISIRKQMVYPPFSHIFVILFTGTDEKKIITVLYRLLDVMNFYNRKGLFEMLGPAPAVVSKIRNNYRWKLLVKCTDEEKIKSFVFYCMEKLMEREELSGITMNMTLDPTMIV